ncbi:MAG: diadenosine tetraphosphate hydrolase [Candidatus Moraniibacteriota bacterium]
MTRTIEDFTGVKKDVKCIGCACATAGQSIAGYVNETELFHVHQDQEVPIPGFVILSTKRHVDSITDFTDAEANEFIALARRIRQAQREVLGIEHVYLVQEEDTEDHFHLWMLPRYDWMKDEAKFGRKVGSAHNVLKFAEQNMKTPDNIALVIDAANKLKEFFN